MPAIHVLRGVAEKEDLDARHKAGHDEREIFDPIPCWVGRVR
jgi:hypothetical protein